MFKNFTNRSATLAAFLLAIATETYAKEINIICTLTNSYTEDEGYKETVGSLTVTIHEDASGNLMSANVNEPTLCVYQRIKTYSSSNIEFDTCARPSWFKPNQVAPDGLLSINRLTGEVTQSVQFHGSNTSLTFFGHCRAGKALF